VSACDTMRHGCTLNRFASSRLTSLPRGEIGERTTI
jgi:hypothetical protein